MEISLDLVALGGIGKDKRQQELLLSKASFKIRKKYGEDIEKISRAGNVIEAPVTNVVKGGLVVTM